MDVVFDDFEQPAPDRPLQLGQGYDMFRDSYLPNIAVYSQTPDGPSPTSINTEAYRIVTNIAENSHIEGSSGGFGFVYKLISVGFGAGSNSENYFNSMDGFARVYRRIQTASVQRTDGYLSDAASDVAGDPTNFLNEFGTHYVQAIYYGHVFDQELQFTLKQSGLTTGTSSDLKFGISGLLGFDYNNNAAQTKVDGLSTTNADVHSRGFIPAIPLPNNALGVQNMVSYVRQQYPKDVAAAAAKDAVPLTIVLSPYSSLAGTGSRFSTWPDTIAEAISGRQDVYGKLLSVISDLNYALALPSKTRTELYNDPAALPNQLKDARAKQQAIRQATEDCRNLMISGTENSAEQVRLIQRLVNAVTDNDLPPLMPQYK